MNTESICQPCGENATESWSSGSSLNSKVAIHAVSVQTEYEMSLRCTAYKFSEKGPVGVSFSNGKWNLRCDCAS